MVAFRPSPSPARYAASVGRAVRILLEDDVRAALDMASCIEACRDAFVAYSSGRAELPGVIHIDVPEARGEIHVKAGHLHGAPYYAVKAASGFYAQEPAAIDGLVLVFDARDGSPAAILLDGGFITDQRTGAAGGVAAAELAPAAVEEVAVIGTGIQARKQVEALRSSARGRARARVGPRRRRRRPRAPPTSPGQAARPSPRRPCARPSPARRWSSRARPRASRWWSSDGWPPART